MRDTYRSGDAVDELLDTDRFTTRAAAEDHIISRMVPAAYAAYPGGPPPRFSAHHAEHWLGYAAHKMSQNLTRDLCWWDVPRWQSTWTLNVAAGVIYGILSGLAFGLASGLKAGLAGGLVLGLTVGIGRNALARLERPQDTDRAVGPLLSWRHDIRRSLLIGIGFALMIGLIAGFTGGIAAGFIVGSLTGLAVWLASSRAWATTLTSAQLSARGDAPIRLVGFLEDARARGVLRTIGSTYQFRDTRLQDRLAVAYATEIAMTATRRVQELLYVPPDPDGQLPRLSTLNPYRLGVSPSRYGSADRRGRDPYVPRKADEELRNALSNSDFALVIGTSRAGKSRTAYEIARQFVREGRLQDPRLIAPRSTDGIEELLALAPLPDRETEPAILWLDDLTEKDLAKLTDAVFDRLAGRAIILGTIAAEFYSRALADDTYIARRVSSILTRATGIQLDRELTVGERAAAQIAYPNERFDRTGIGEQLVSAVLWDTCDQQREDSGQCTGAQVFHGRCLDHLEDGDLATVLHLPVEDKPRDLDIRGVRLLPGRLDRIMIASRATDDRIQVGALLLELAVVHGDVNLTDASLTGTSISLALRLRAGYTLPGQRSMATFTWWALQSRVI